MKTEDKIREEELRLLSLYEGVEEDSLALALPLIQNAAFMKVKLEELQEQINSKGVVDEYQNGATQRGYKASVEMQTYNTLIKNYSSVIKELDKLLQAKPMRSAPSQTIKEILERELEEEDHKGMYKYLGENGSIQYETEEEHNKRLAAMFEEYR